MEVFQTLTLPDCEMRLRLFNKHILQIGCSVRPASHAALWQKRRRREKEREREEKREKKQQQCTDMFLIPFSEKHWNTQSGSILKMDGYLV